MKFIKYIIFCVLIIISVLIYINAEGIQRFSLSIISDGLIIGTPNNLHLGSLIAGSSVDYVFDDYFWIRDLRGRGTGHYTTIQLNSFYGPNGFIITGVQLLSDSIELRGGNINNTHLNNDLSIWTDITMPKLFFYRNTELDGGGINEYGTKPSIRITVPTDAPSGNYRGKITYTLYDYGVDIAN